MTFDADEFIRTAVPHMLKTPEQSTQEITDSKEVSLTVKRRSEIQYDLLFQDLSEGRSHQMGMPMTLWYSNLGASYYVDFLAIQSTASEKLAWIASNFFVALLWYIAGHPWIKASFACFAPCVLSSAPGRYRPALAPPGQSDLPIFIFSRVRVNFNKSAGLSWHGAFPYVPLTIQGEYQLKYERLVTTAILSLIHQEFGMVQIRDPDMIEYLKTVAFEYDAYDTYALLWPFQNIWNTLQILGIANVDLDDIRKKRQSGVIDFVE